MKTPNGSQGEPPCKLALADARKAPLKHAVIESKAQQALVDMLAADLCWNAQGLWALQFGCVWFPLKNQIQALALKYRHRPADFFRQFQRVLGSHFRKLEKDPVGRENLAQLAWFKRQVEEALAPVMSGGPQEHPEHPFTLPQDTPQKKLAALDALLSAISAPFLGRVERPDPKKVIANVQALAARTPGPEPLKRYGKHVEKYLNGEPPPTIHQICTELEPGYTRKGWLERKETRNKVSRGLVRCLRYRLKKLGVTKFPSRRAGLREALLEAQSRHTKSKN